MGDFKEKNGKEIDISKNKEYYKACMASSGKRLASSVCNYLLGHPNIINQTSGILEIRENGIYFSKSLPFSCFIVPIENVIDVEFKDETQISKDVTLTRLIGLGAYAFGAKKTTKDIKMYLIIKYIENNIEGTLMFESHGSGIINKNANQLAGALIKARHEFAKSKIDEDKNKSDNIEEIATTENNTDISNSNSLINVKAEVIYNVDEVIEQIKKLGELKEAGILTDVEFQNKKTELLARI